MGRYHKMEGKLQNKKPVWKKEGPGYNRYIYFKGATKEWVVDNDLNETAVSLLGPSDDAYSNQKIVPRFGWKYWDGNKWADDESLIISGGY